LDQEDGVIRFLGYGIYVGDFIPDEDAGALAELCREEDWPNPKIVLDNGKVVWGGECWWENEQDIVEELKNAEEVINVDIDEIRKSRER
jgi:hypothetical protein